MNVNSFSGGHSGSPDQEEFNALLVPMLPRLRRFCFALAGREGGDDLCQATLAKALAARSQFEDGSRLDSWLFRIARNHLFDQSRRARTRGQELGIEVAEMLPGEDGVRTLEGRSDIARVADAFAHLSAEQREVMTLVVIDGQSYRDAAAVLDIPVGTVMSRLARARQALDGALRTKDTE